MVWLYDSFGAAGTVTAQTRDADLGTTLVTFANGTRLTVKQTPFEKDRIRIKVSLGQGRAGVPAPLVHALPDIQRWGQSGGKFVGATLESDSLAFHLNGVTRPADLAAKPVGADELARAVRPVIQREIKLRESNEWWVENLATIWRENRAKAALVTKPDRFATITATEVQAFVAKRMAGQQPVVVIARAAEKAGQ
ncbi:hypothetical protein [Novosphingobium sp.]|uniref:hypothetical protein n=1 Tax=Novosphingobium sp. TaxID=1874826 RepID=UPI00260D2FBE|nr:hypothetical protein [Novosphingobium sp.]